jgi:hypothetical protein
MRTTLLLLATLVASVPPAYAEGGAGRPMAHQAGSLRFQGLVSRHVQSPGRITGNDTITRATGHIAIEGDQARLSLSVKKPGWDRVPVFGWDTLTLVGRVTERGPNVLRLSIPDSLANRKGMQWGVKDAVVKSATGAFELRTGSSGALELRSSNNLTLSVPGYGTIHLTMNFEGDDIQLR